MLGVECHGLGFLGYGDASLTKIKVTPIAFESLGVRSMCTLIKTPDISILMDPGVSLGQRYGLLPHPEEYRALMEARGRVVEASAEADVLTVSHYHFDHYTPLGLVDYVWMWSDVESSEKIYYGKEVLVKSVRRDINFSQRRRGWIFERMLLKVAERVKVADGSLFEYGGTKLSFSKPVFHGEEDTALGWVLMTVLECEGEKFLYAPDVQGPVSGETLSMILSEGPRMIIMGGPPLYLARFKIDEVSVKRSLENMVKIAESTPLMILEHHLLRDKGWREFSKPVFEAASRSKNKVKTAAEYLGKKDNLLEFKRRELYEAMPISQEFMDWAKQTPLKRKLIKPPLTKPC